MTRKLLQSEMRGPFGRWARRTTRNPIVDWLERVGYSMTVRMPGGRRGLRGFERRQCRCARGAPGEVPSRSRCRVRRTCRSEGRRRPPRVRLPRVRRPRRLPPGAHRPRDALGHDLRLVHALQRVEEIAGALDPYAGIEQRYLRQVFQIVGKVRQLMQDEVRRERANGALESRAVEDVADDRLRSLAASRPAFSADLVIAPTV